MRARNRNSLYLNIPGVDVIGGGANVTVATGDDADLAMQPDELLRKESAKPKPHATLQEEKLQYWDTL